MGKHSQTRYARAAAISIFLGVALALPSGGAAKAATPPAALNGGVAAFEASNTDLYLCDIPQNGCTNTGLGMEAGASPTVYSEDNGLVWAAFEANTKKLYVTERSANGAVKNLNTGLDIADLTTPSITEWSVDPNSEPSVAVAFHGINGNLDIYYYDINSGSSSWVNTGLPMYAGTSPSVVSTTDGFSAITELVVAYADSANHLGVYYTEPGVAGSATGTTTLGMEAGTSPSITAISPSGGNDSFSVAFEDNNSQLYLAYFGYGASQSSMHLKNIAEPMEAHTNPSLPRGQIIGSNANEVSAYMGASGYLCAWNDTIAAQSCFQQLVSGSPAIALVQGTYWAAFESNSSGNFRAVNTATGAIFEQPMYNNTNAALSS